MADKMTGGCACGRIRFAATVADDEAYLCHCRMCQRASGNVSLAMKTMEQSDIAWEAEPDWYRSSPIAQRPYCASCGTSLGFRYDKDTTKMDLTVASFDDPARFVPKHHFGTESLHEAWINTTGLPRMRSDEYERLQKRWAEADAEPPQQAKK